ncbi:hypothetical protein [Methanolobus sp. ZRKC5]|uniref:hypothetical protein n=1 Tax=unclassified Methanolobus TaxID=2629569 RepID=UPI00313D4477
MDSVNQYGSQFTNISDFLKDVKYIILFYVLGDFLTTVQALNYGFEENNFLAAVFQSYGVESLLVLKVFFLAIVYWNYRILKESDSRWTDLLWVLSRKSISIVGLFLVMNNLMVIFMECSVLQVIHTMTF